MPEDWRLMTQQHRGEIRTDRGFVSYQKFAPSTRGSGPPGQSVLWTAPMPGTGDENGWFVVSHVPQERVQRIIEDNQILPAASRWIIGAFVWIVSWLIALLVCMNRVRMKDLKAVATFDGLTGLINRSEFNRNLQRAISLAKRNKRSMGVVFIDVNEFKALNDEYGHAAGDKVLMAIGERLTQSCRDSDVAARLGGDEFAVILWEIANFADAETAAKSIASRVREPLLLDHGEYQTSVSVGAAVYPEDGATAEALLAISYQKMYEDKSRFKAEKRASEELATKVS